LGNPKIIRNVYRRLPIIDKKSGYYNLATDDSERK